MTRFSDAITSTFSVLSKTTVPLYADSDQGEPCLCGTGFFISIRGTVLLITAAHVLDEAAKAQLYYFIGHRQQRLVVGKVTRNKWNGPRDKDLLDLAAVRLEAPALPPYIEVDKYPLDYSSLEFIDGPSTSARYGAIGYPASRARIRYRPAEIRVSPYAHLAEAASLREYAAKGLKPESHLYLVFNRKKSFSLNGEGRSFPKPHGMSGAPVFEIYDEAKSHQGESFPIAGVVTTWRPHEHRLLCASAYALHELIEIAA